MRGNLVSDVNRPTDADLSTKTETITLNLGGRDENEVIDALLHADGSYGDDLDYDIFAAPSDSQRPLLSDDGYNSNSCVSGVLTAVGLQPPPLRSNVPGYIKPVPEEEFEPQATP